MHRGYWGTEPRLPSNRVNKLSYLGNYHAYPDRGFLISGTPICKTMRSPFDWTWKCSFRIMLRYLYEDMRGPSEREDWPPHCTGTFTIQWRFKFNIWMLNTSSVNTVSASDPTSSQVLILLLIFRKTSRFLSTFLCISKSSLHSCSVYLPLAYHDVQ